MRLKTILAIFVCFFVLGIGQPATRAQSSVQAACAPRADWSTYRVTYGDTLFKVAVRHSISTSALAAANCITNINLIFVGQILRVPPPGGGGVTGTFDIPVTFQQYEKGFMIWRGDTGDIWVYVGQTSGNASRYPSTSYGRLPENPVSGVTPPGRVRPILGFGKVWGNFPSVRTALGWATGHELSYIMHYSPVTTTIFYFSLPDSRVAFNNSPSWAIYSGTIPPGAPTPIPSGTSIVTINAAYQVFENGALLWRGDTGRIYIFTKTYVAEYSVTDYGPLPDNPITLVPPPGRVSPINGFGRVWGNYAEARNVLGWGLGNEQGFTATFKTDLATSINCVNLPTGQFVSFPHYTGNRSWMWQYETSCG